MLQRERKMLNGGHESYHAIIVAAPKSGLARWYAIAHYFIGPKLRRIRWEILTRLRPNEDVVF